MADASVRPATAADAADIARIQATVWAGVHSDLPAAVLEAVGSAEAAEQWAMAATDPPSPRHRVLTALAGERVVGFAALAPASDPDTIPSLDGDLLALCVDPAETGRGHGSRLVNAAADLARDRRRRAPARLALRRRGGPARVPRRRRLGRRRGDPQAGPGR